MSWAQDERGLWSLTCDVCQDGWYGWDGDVFFTEPADLEAVAVLNHWAFGDGEAVCSVCSLARECARSGHRWGPWERLPDVGKHVRFCIICTAGEYR